MSCRHHAAESRGKSGMGSIRALRSRRDVGTVAGCLESREVRLRGLCEHGRHRGHESARSKVAALAVRVIDAPAIASIVRSRHDLAAGQVLVLVMAEMLLGQSTRLVRAVRRSRGPDHLERHHAQQEDEHPTTHIFYVTRTQGFRAMASAPSGSTGPHRQHPSTLFVRNLQAGEGQESIRNMTGLSCEVWLRQPWLRRHRSSRRMDAPR